MKSFKKVLAGVCSLVMLSAVATSVVSANDELGSSIGGSGNIGDTNIGESGDKPNPGDSNLGDSDEPGPGNCSGVDYVLGDLNNDGQVKSNDLLLLKKYLLGLSEVTPQGLANADVTHDGEVNSNDLLKLKKFLLGLLDTLAE